MTSHTAPAVPTTSPAFDDILSRLEPRVRSLPAHPRLVLTPESAGAWGAAVDADPRLAACRSGLVARCETILTQPPVERRMEGRRLLGRSREAVYRILHLAAAWRLTGDARYAQRAEREMLAAAAFTDWNPSHFLDVAEMTTAMAFGYDWLYDVLPATTLQAVREAIVHKGIEPSLDEAAGGNWWVTTQNNWNPVCHGGLTAGALAVAEDEPALAARVAARAVFRAPIAMAEYEPDGAYPEGPGYWEYGTSYNVLLIAVLRSALGSDFGLSARPAFLASGDYPLHMRGPTGQWFNYADCGASHRVDVSAPLFWMARERRAPYLLYDQVPALTAWCGSVKGGDRFAPLAMLWAGGLGRIEPPAALSWCGRGPTPVAVHRTSWTDPRAVFAGIKAGRAGENHGHMDAGAFVLDAGGIRWALDLGSQSYNSIESRGMNLWNRKPDSDRWKVFRINNLSHNTLVVDGRHQEVEGFARIAEHALTPEPHTEVDLTDVYAGQLARAARTLTLRKAGTVVIEDRLQALGRACSVRWGMVTGAGVTIDRAKVTLRQEGQALTLDATGLDGASWEVYPTDPPPADYDAANPGTRMIGFTVRLAPDERRTLRVECRLAGGNP